MGTLPEFKCKGCGETFATEQEFKRHIHWLKLKACPCEW
jgi:hypothetical protein